MAGSNGLSKESQLVTSHTYQYDAVNRRTQATLEDNSYWQYGYNDRSELTGANRYWSYFATTTPVSGQQFGYAYDNIGNRQTASFGGDAGGNNCYGLFWHRKLCRIGRLAALPHRDSQQNGRALIVRL